MTTGRADESDSQADEFRYPSLRRDPRELRSRRANGIAALALLALLVAIVIAVALFG